MHEKAIQSHINTLVKVANGLLYPSGHICAGQKIVGGQEHTNAHEKTIDADAEYEILTFKGLYPEWSKKFSTEFIRAQLKQILFKVTDARSIDPIDEAFRELVHKYDNFNSKCSVVIPLVGFTVTEPIKLGNITIRNYMNETWDELFEQCTAIMRVNPNYTDEQKLQHREHMDAKFLSIFKEKPCAEFTVVAESIRAVELTTIETQRTLDLIRYAILFLHPKKYTRAVGIIGDVASDPITHVALTPGSSVNYGQELRNFPFDINATMLRKMREIGVFELSELIANESKSNFDKMLLDALHWLASAQTQLQNQNTLLNLVTCLETFLKPDKGEPITAHVSEGVALLINDNLADRKKTKAMMKDFYTKRSTLVHGSSEEVTNFDIHQLINMCRSVVAVLLKNRTSFKTHKEFKAWLDDQKLLGMVKFPAPE